MSTPEEDLLQQIESNNQLLKNSRLEVNKLKSQLTEAETKMIFHKLQEAKLQEQLRKLKASMVKYEPIDDLRLNEIERFKKVLPELLSKLDNVK